MARRTGRIATTFAVAWLLAGPSPAVAQPASKPARFTIGVSGGVQQAAEEVSDRFSFAKNVETENVDVKYPMKPWGLIDLAAGYRVWKNIGVGIAVSATSGKGDADVTASIPHPFFFNQPRTITGTDISLDPGRRASAALALARAFATMGDVPADLQVDVSVADREEVLPVHLARLGREPVRAGRSTGGAIIGNLGRMVGGMRILHRPHTANPDRLLAARAVAPLDRNAALAEVEHAIRRHNAALSGSAAAAEPI